jgi:hypothetical protein
LLQFSFRPVSGCDAARLLSWTEPRRLAPGISPMKRKQSRKSAHRAPGKRAAKKRAVKKHAATKRATKGRTIKKRTKRVADAAHDMPPPPRPLPPMPDTSSFDAAAAHIIAEWRARLRAPEISTGGQIELPLVPLESFPPRTPAPDLSKWGGIQLDPVSTPPDLAGLSDDEAAEVIKAWFFSNFEDPIHEMPRDEGDYIYIWGGPYEARDVIWDVFADAASENAIESAIRAVEADGVDWAPHGSRVQPPKEDFADDSSAVSKSPDPRKLHAEMLARIAELEEALARLPPRRRGIGDNNPPEPIEPEVLGDADRRAVETAIAVLKAQPPEPTEAPAEALKAAHFLSGLAKRLRNAVLSAGQYLGKQADTLVSAAVKSAGSEIGKRAVQSPFWLAVIDRICAVADAAIHWINSLSLPF